MKRQLLQGLLVGIVGIAGGGSVSAQVEWSGDPVAGVKVDFAPLAERAESTLSCWNIFSKKGSPPIFTAEIKPKGALGSAVFDLKNPYFEDYFIDKTEDSGERWGHKPAVTKSLLANPKGVLKPELITSNRSPYKGNNEYTFELGSYSFRSPYSKADGTYDARLILPTDLSARNLKNFRIRVPNERSNAVMILNPAYDAHQGGDNYLRMFCLSR